MAEARQFGSYEVTIFVDGTYKAPVEHLVHLGNPVLREEIVAQWGRPTIDVDVNLFCLRGADGLTLIDTGAGTAWGADYGKSRAAMAEAGILPGDVKRILLTHVHGDHALGLFDGVKAYFPAAEIWVPAVEQAFFTSEAARQSLPESRRSAFGIMARILEIYGERVRTFAPGAILPGIEAIPMPGHTPGHTGFSIGEGREALMIWGDVLHTDLQAKDPEIGFIYDVDPAVGLESRRAVLARAAQQGCVVSGGHVSGFARVERDGMTFRLIPA